MNLTHLRKKAKIILSIIRLKNDFNAGIFGPESRIKSIVSDELSSALGANSIQGKFRIQQTIDTITARILQKPSITENFNKTIDSFHSHQMWYYSVVAGYASLWELKVKLLAEQIGVAIKVPFDQRSKRHLKDRMLPFRELSEIISDIERKITPNAQLRLFQTNSLRSALVHGNMDQLRILANNCSHKFKADHRGDVFVFSLENPSDGTNLSDNLPIEKREMQSLFSWFLDATNSKLLEEIWLILDKSISQVNAIVDFKACSFDEREAFFSQTFYEGKPITLEIMEKYAEVLKIQPQRRSIQSYFSNLKILFGKKIFTPDSVKKLDAKLEEEEEEEEDKE